METLHVQGSLEREETILSNNKRTDKWRKNNPDLARKYSREYARIYRKRLREIDLQKYKDRTNKYSSESRKKLRDEVLVAYGSKCSCCGESEKGFLTVDHVHNDGSSHRKVVSGPFLYKWLKKNGFPKDGFQLLCWNCNIAKFRYGKCPHQKTSK